MSKTVASILLLLVVCAAASFVYGKRKGSSEMAPAITSVPTENRHAAVSRSSASSGAAGLITHFSGSAAERARIVSDVAARCASFVVNPAGAIANDGTPTKLSGWCKGIDRVISPTDLRALMDARASSSTEVMNGAAALYDPKGGKVEFAEETRLLRLASSPQEVAAVAQVIDRNSPDELWSRAGLQRSDSSRPEVLSRFAGLAAGCQQGYCDVNSLSTMDVCMWPGNTCSESADFDQALSENFSQNDIARIRLLAGRLVSMKSG